MNDISMCWFLRPDYFQLWLLCKVDLSIFNFRKKGEKLKFCFKKDQLYKENKDLNATKYSRTFFLNEVLILRHGGFWLRLYLFLYLPLEVLGSGYICTSELIFTTPRVVEYNISIRVPLTAEKHIIFSSELCTAQYV